MFVGHALPFPPAPDPELSLQVLKWWDWYIDLLKHVCRLLSSPFSSERLVNQCFSTAPHDVFAGVISAFRAYVYDGRWGTVYNAAHLLLDIMIPLTRGWNKNRYLAGGGFPTFFLMRPGRRTLGSSYREQRTRTNNGRTTNHSAAPHNVKTLLSAVRRAAIVRSFVSPCPPLSFSVLLYYPIIPGFVRQVECYQRPTNKQKQEALVQQTWTKWTGLLIPSSFGA